MTSNEEYLQKREREISTSGRHQAVKSLLARYKCEATSA